MHVREARPEEHATVVAILDAAMLDTDPAAVGERIPGDVLVAAEAGRLLGALVPDGRALEAVAVRPGRRGQGVGTALVDAAAARRNELVAGFDADVRRFYERLGFEVEPAGDGRFRGVYRG